MCQRLLLGTLLFVFAAMNAGARDLGFRYTQGQCVDANGTKGLNPGFLGPCGDLRGLDLQFFSFDDTDLSGAMFDGANLQMATLARAALDGVSFRKADLSGADLAAASFRGAVFTGAVLKGVKLAGAVFDGVDFSGTDLSGSDLNGLTCTACDLRGIQLPGAALDHVNLSRSQLTGANLVGAVLTASVLDGVEISNADFSGDDLSGASLVNAVGTSANFAGAIFKNANFQRARLQTANLRGAQFEGASLAAVSLQQSDVRAANLAGAQFDKPDLTGVIYNKSTKLPFSSDQAVKYKMVFLKGAELLIIVDAQNNPGILALKKFLEDGGNTVTLSAQISSAFTGANLKGYSAILHLNGDDTYYDDMPVAGQDALVAFVKNGGTFVYTELDSFAHDYYRRLQRLDDLILSKYTNNGNGAMTFKVVKGQERHPLLAGVKDALSITTLWVTGAAKTFAVVNGTKPTQPIVLMDNGSGGELVVAREFGKGRVVGLGMTGTYNGQSSLDQAGVRLLISNAVNW